MPNEDGSSNEKNLRQVAKSFNIDEDDYIIKWLKDQDYYEDFPIGLENIWEIFLKLSSGRASSGFGPNPISYLDIKSWADINNVKLYPWEVGLIRDLDTVYLKVISARSSRTRNQNQNDGSTGSS